MNAFGLFRSSTVLTLVVAAFAFSASAGCSKENKADGDAAADVTAAEAAAPVADATVETDAAVDAAPALLPVAPTVAPRPTVKAPPPDPPICANARAARKRNNPAAAGLEAQCRAAGGTP